MKLSCRSDNGMAHHLPEDRASTERIGIPVSHRQESCCEDRDIDDLDPGRVYNSATYLKMTWQKASSASASTPKASAAAGSSSKRQSAQASAHTPAHTPQRQRAKDPKAPPVEDGAECREPPCRVEAARRSHEVRVDRAEALLRGRQKIYATLNKMRACYPTCTGGENLFSPPVRARLILTDGVYFR